LRPLDLQCFTAPHSAVIKEKYERLQMCWQAGLI
jgi:hypothetical protein